jgi:hypothetical protein
MKIFFCEKSKISILKEIFDEKGPPYFSLARFEKNRRRRRLKHRCQVKLFLLSFVETSGSKDAATIWRMTIWQMAIQQM